MTYEEARPWARSIKARVSARECRPGSSIATSASSTSRTTYRCATTRSPRSSTAWMEGADGRPEGPASRGPVPGNHRVADWRADLVVEMPGELTVKAAAPDWWADIVTELPAVTEDRYIKAVEVKPIKGYDTVHHAVAGIVSDEVPADGTGTLVESSMGKNGDIYPEGTGRLLRRARGSPGTCTCTPAARRRRRRSPSLSSSIPGLRAEVSPSRAAGRRR